MIAVVVIKHHHKPIYLFQFMLRNTTNGLIKLPKGKGKHQHHMTQVTAFHNCSHFVVKLFWNRLNEEVVSKGLRSESEHKGLFCVSEAPDSV